MQQHQLQAMLDGLSAQWQKERSQTQMTLGKLIDVLAQMPPDTKVANLRDAHSYRGYYSDLAFEWTSTDKQTAAELLAQCQACMGEVFTGYKGGEFQMGRNTPIWIASWGSTGDKLMEIVPGGGVISVPDTY
jgi:hypothetical protein